MYNCKCLKGSGNQFRMGMCFDRLTKGMLTKNYFFVKFSKLLILEA